jgi:hypothetical protein
MEKSAKKRGRPQKAHPKTAAERMQEYRKRKRDAGFRSVRRWEPADNGATARYSDHRVLDARSLAMHCKVVQKISRDPQLLDKAKENLRRWIAKSAGSKPRYLREWEEILERPWHEIAGLITDMSEEATRLRSSSPFAGVISPEEREQIYAAFRT